MKKDHILKDLINNIDILTITGNVDIVISGIQSDSRKIENNFLFVATKGVNTDGHDFIYKAIANGAIEIGRAHV